MSEGVRGVRGVHSDVREAVSRQEVACAWPAGGEHAPLSFCPRRKTIGGQRWWAGPPATVLGLLVGAR